MVQLLNVQEAASLGIESLIDCNYRDPGMITSRWSLLGFKVIRVTQVTYCYGLPSVVVRRALTFSQELKNHLANLDQIKYVASVV